jgi:hypothetical protein
MSGPMVAVVGRRVKPPTADLNLAYRVGLAVAELGMAVVTGGRGGIMEAAALGARFGHGEVVAITPYDEEPIGLFTTVIKTGLTAQMRNVVTGSCCDVMIALPGSHGTWQEIAVGLDRGIPVLSLGTHQEVLPGTQEVPECELKPTLRSLTADWMSSRP